MNATQLIILGGFPHTGEVNVFDVNHKTVNKIFTSDFKFCGVYNQCSQIKDGKVVALVINPNYELCMISYTEGARTITLIDNFGR